MTIKLQFQMRLFIVLPVRRHVSFVLRIQIVVSSYIKGYLWYIPAKDITIGANMAVLECARFLLMCSSARPTLLYFKAASSYPR